MSRVEILGVEYETKPAPEKMPCIECAFLQGGLKCSLAPACDNVIFVKIKKDENSNRRKKRLRLPY